MGSALSTSTSSTTHGGTRYQLPQTDYLSTLHSNFTELSDEIYDDHVIYQHNFFDDSLHQKGVYTDIAAQLPTITAENGSAFRSEHLFCIKSKSTVGDTLNAVNTLGLKRLLSGLNRKTRGPTIHGRTETRRSQSQIREGKQRTWKLSSSRRAEEDCDSQNFKEKPSHKSDIAICETRKDEEDNEELNNVFNTNSNNNESFLTSRKIGSTKGGRSGSFNGSFRNGTPYFRPQEAVKPICNACNHLSMSVYQNQLPHQTCTKPLSKYFSLDTADQEDINVPHSYHVHFNKTNQISEPNTSPSHNYLQASNRLKTEVILQRNSVNGTPNMIYTQKIGSRQETLDQEQSYRGSLDIDSTGEHNPFFHHVIVTAPSVQVTSCSNFTPNETHGNLCNCKALNLMPADNNHSINSYPYHMSFRPYSFSELSLSTSPDYLSKCLHPSINHPSSSAVDPSQAHNFRLINDCLEPIGTAHYVPHPHLTTLNESLISIQKPNSTKNEVQHKSLTKSISCYALKFFNYHQTQPRLKTSEKSELSLNCVPIKTREKTKKKTTEKSQNKKSSLRLNRSHDEQKTTENNQCCMGTPYHTRQEVTDQSNLSWYDSHRQGVVQQNKIDPSTLHSRTRNEQHFQNEDNFTHQAHTPNRGSKNNQHVKSIELRRKDGKRSSRNSSYPCYTFKNESEPFELWMSKEGLGSSLYKTVHHTDSRHTVCKAGTSELLRCLSFFVVTRLQFASVNDSNSSPGSNSDHARIGRLRLIQPSVIVGWIKSIDRALLLQGWSELAFINPAHVVFLFMLLKECMEHEITSERELHTIIMACLYLSYSYMGNEISYPLKPFLVAETNQLLIHHRGVDRRLLEGENALLSGFESSVRTKVIDQVRNRFWQYCLRIITIKSSDMLKINASPMRFTELFTELKSYNSLVMPLNVPLRLVNTPK